jgi:hypothetical protein
VKRVLNRGAVALGVGALLLWMANMAGAAAVLAENIVWGS